MMFLGGGVTAAGGATMRRPHVSVAAPSGVTPDLEEDFSTYTSTANFLTDPRDIYNTVEDIRTERMTIDTGIGYGGSSQSLRYNYPSGTATDYTISRMLDITATVPTETWVEIVVRFSSDFTVNGNGQGGASAMKLMHVEINGPPSGRFGLGFNNGDSGEVAGEGPNDNFQAFFIGGSATPGSLFDAEWHTLRYHCRVGASDFHEFWVDGVYQGSAAASTAATDFWGVALARNVNKLSGVDMEMWWGRVRVYFSDPGW